MKTVFCSLLVLYILFHAGEGLKCYKCDSFSHPPCEDQFLTGDNERPSECLVEDEEPLPLTRGGSSKDGTQEEFLCVKVEFLNATQFAGTIRSCTLLGEETCPTVERIVESQGGSVTFCETCSAEQCNSGSTLALSLTTAVMSATVLAALRRF